MNRETDNNPQSSAQTHDGSVRWVSERRHRLQARVLVVDDNSDTLLLLAAFLEAEGFEVVCADSAIAARESTRAETPDLIITDFRMPGMTGLELCETLRAEPRTRHIPIILHTATALTDPDTACYDELAPKPVELQLLRQQVHKLLRCRMHLVSDKSDAEARGPTVFSAVHH